MKRITTLVKFGAIFCFFFSYSFCIKKHPKLQVLVDFEPKSLNFPQNKLISMSETYHHACQVWYYCPTYFALKAAKKAFWLRHNLILDIYLVVITNIWSLDLPKFVKRLFVYDYTKYCEVMNFLNDPDLYMSFSHCSWSRVLQHIMEGSRSVNMDPTKLKDKERAQIKDRFKVIVRIFYYLTLHCAFLHLWPIPSEPTSCRQLYVSFFIVHSIDVNSVMLISYQKQ